MSAKVCVAARWRRHPASEGRSRASTPSIEGIADVGSDAHAQAVKALLGAASARNAFDRILRLSREGTASDDGFLAELSRQLREIVPFDASFWSGVDPVTLLAASPSRIEHIYSDSKCYSYWENEFLVQDVNDLRTLTRAAKPAASLYRATDGHPARSFRYRNLNEPRGFGDELRCVFRTGRGVWGFVCLWRGEGAQSFSLTEERLLCALSTPVGEAFRRSALLRSGASVDLPDAPGLLMFDRAGMLESLNDPAEAWLRELPLTHINRDNSLAVPIPIELLTVANQAQAIAAGHDGGTARVRLLSRTGRWLVIHGFALREANAQGGRTALVIEPATATEMAPIIVEAYQLGPREQQVTWMVARGLSTAEIAMRLSLSTHTVRDYLKQVFEKVAVSTRGELVAKIFNEYYEQPLNAAMQTDLPGALDPTQPVSHSPAARPRK
jgi:DNA-binding CsgD family transcriptional regulator